MDRAEIEAVCGALPAEQFDVFDIKDQLDDRLTAALTFCGLMKQDVGAAIAGDKLDNPVSGQSGCREAKMPFVEAGGFLDIPGVDDDPAEWHR
ncbi:hypothetical protein QFZ88_003471 [Mesorhizobium sp. YL-MeA3-2017]|nr:hypothetical protein [Mesorhizobium sp. YL-MeA3-2017]